MFKKAWTLVAVCVAVLGLTACASLKPVAPKVTSVSVKLGMVSLLQQQMTLSVGLHNPNPFSLPVRNLSYRLLAGADNTELGAGQTAAGIQLPAMGDGKIELSFNANLLTTLLRLQPNFRQGGELPIRLVGQIQVSDWLTVPLEKTTQLKLR